MFDKGTFRIEETRRGQGRQFPEDQTIIGKPSGSGEGDAVWKIKRAEGFESNKMSH